MGLHAMKWAFSVPIERSGAKFVLVALAEHARDDGEDAWTCFPSIKRLGEWTSQGERTIERHLSWLVAEGWISREVRHDRHRNDSTYLYVLRRDKPVVADGLVEVGKGRTAAKIAPVRRVAFRQSGADLPPNSTGSSAKLAPPYIEEPVIEPVSEPATPKARDIDVGFVEFWSAFPNKIEERGARATFARLIRNREATADTLIEGAKRYAASMRGQDLRFVKSPTSWLTKGCWADGLPAATAPVGESQATAATFEGPADVWEAVAASKGDAWARSYLAPCAWSGSIRALSPRTGFAARKLRDELGRLLRELSIAIIDPSAMMGAAHAH